MTTENRYSHGKIYKLIDNRTGMFYFGSTALKRLDQRYSKHKNSSKNEDKNKTKLYQQFTFNKFSCGDIRIILIEEVSVNTKQELVKIENAYIEKNLNNPLCLNTHF